MGIIHILDEVVANQIAAGEVVEKPQSIVKELLENALDAGATQIDVHIEEGGLKRILVSDNGKGMAPEDAVLCLSRYATSKLQSPEDLHQLNSFGFRGEALPSIASVSKMTITTRQDNQAVASQVQCDGGRVTHVGEAGAPVGTSIDVKDLFFNVPARRKFLKSERSEAAAIEASVKVAAMGCLHVGFKLYQEGKCILDIRPADTMAELGNPRVLERFIQCVGEETRGFIHPFEAHTDIVHLSGHIVAPLVSRRDYGGMYLYVNQRPVQDKQLQQAVKVAFRTLLEVGRQPICALHIGIDKSIVDVNVHPQKREVRFCDPSRVTGHIIRLLSDFLATTPWLTPTTTQTPQPALGVSTWTMRQPTQKFDLPPRMPTMEVFQELMHRPPVEPQRSATAVTSMPTSTPVPTVLTQTSFIAPTAMRYADLRIVGQVANTFILLEGHRCLFVLDQHAAHERVMFERLIAQVKEHGLASQALLLPLQLRLDAQSLAVLSEQGDLLKQFGFELEPFGDQHAILKATPACLPIEEAANLSRDVLSDLVTYARPDALDELRDKLCAQLACHGSIRSGQSLSQEEIKSLLVELDVVDFSAHCPHGRPVLKKIAFEEMATWFNRHSI